MRHHNIVRYCEAFVERKKLYIVLEFAKYGDLSHVIKKQQSKRRFMSEHQVMTLFVQICLALRHLHKHNILHRDLKPQNIFVGDDFKLKLGDFGCSKLLDRIRLARTQVGTPYYMSPEIWNNKRYDAKSDVWSLGCILFELASLGVPFKARNLPQLAAKVANTKTPLIPTTYSTNLRRLAKALLAKDPERRPSISQILNLSFVKDFIETNREALERPKNTTPSKMNLLRTIALPRGHQPLRKLSFPESQYPRGRPQSSPARPMRAMPPKIRPRIVSSNAPLPHIGRGVARRLAANANPKNDLVCRGESPFKKYGKKLERPRRVQRAIVWDKPVAKQHRKPQRYYVPVEPSRVGRRPVAPPLVGHRRRRGAVPKAFRF